MENVLTPHIEITPGVASGKPRIVGHRITVQNIAIWHERTGLSADEIAATYELSRCARSRSSSQFKGAVRAGAGGTGDAEGG